MEPERFQIFVEFPSRRRHCQALEVSPNQTLGDLKRSFLPIHDEALASFALSFNGKTLSDSSRILDASICPLSTLILRIRAVGGGGDGGATGAESRDCYLNMYAIKKPDKVDPNETRLSKWTTCRLSGEPLKPPCVIDQLGNVFNKEALVEALLGKKLPKEFCHIKGLKKDMIPIRLEEIPGVEFDDSTFNTRFQCPISGLEFNGKYKFFALRGCGHVLSAKAVKEVQCAGCLVCHGEFVESDKIVINGDEEEVEALRLRMEEARSNKSKGKKEKRTKNGEVGSTVPDALVRSVASVGDDHSIPVSSHKKIVSKDVDILQPGDAGKESELPTKRLKTVIRTPANATKEVYQSIFTSSKKSDFKETFTCRSLPLGRN